MNHKERMISGRPYKCWLDGLPEARLDTASKLYEYNLLHPRENSRRYELLCSILGGTGPGVMINAPFYCDYGVNIYIGKNFFANYNCTMLDVAQITIGDNCLFGPNVALYTAGHPLHPDTRNMGYEYGVPITIGDNVWIGGSTVVNPGVTIGSNVVIGGGSVVTKDIPDNTIAVGNPCRVLREITDEDRRYYYKDRVFEPEDFRS